MIRENQVAALKRAACYLSEQPDLDLFEVQFNSFTANAAVLESVPDYTPPDLSTTLYAADNIEDFVTFVHLLGNSDG